MFRSASQIDSERTASGIRRIKASWESSADSWFDGSVDSVDRRIALCERLIHKASAATGRLLDRPESGHYMKLASDLQADHAALTQMRRDLLTAAMDRDPDEWAQRTAMPSGTWAYCEGIDPGNRRKNRPDDKGRCPHCGTEVKVNADGSMRVHKDFRPPGSGSVSGGDTFRPWSREQVREYDRRKADQQLADALSVDCPSCGTPAGEPCPEIGNTGFHAKRLWHSRS